MGPGGPNDVEAAARQAQCRASASRFQDRSLLLEDENYWDHEALMELIAYGAGPKQIWDKQGLGGPWLEAGYQYAT